VRLDRLPVTQQGLDLGWNTRVVVLRRSGERFQVPQDRRVDAHDLARLGVLVEAEHTLAGHAPHSIPHRALDEPQHALSRARRVAEQGVHALAGKVAQHRFVHRLQERGHPFVERDAAIRAVHDAVRRLERGVVPPATQIVRHGLDRVHRAGAPLPVRPHRSPRRARLDPSPQASKGAHEIIAHVLGHQPVFLCAQRFFQQAGVVDVARGEPGQEHLIERLTQVVRVDLVDPRLDLFDPTLVQDRVPEQLIQPRARDHLADDVEHAIRPQCVAHTVQLFKESVEDLALPGVLADHVPDRNR